MDITLDIIDIEFAEEELEFPVKDMTRRKTRKASAKKDVRRKKQAYNVGHGVNWMATEKYVSLAAYNKDCTYEDVLSSPIVLSSTKRSGKAVYKRNDHKAARAASKREIDRMYFDEYEDNE